MRTGELVPYTKPAEVEPTVYTQEKNLEEPIDAEIVEEPTPPEVNLKMKEVIRAQGQRVDRTKFNTEPSDQGEIYTAGSGETILQEVGAETLSIPAALEEMQGRINHIASLEPGKVRQELIDAAKIAIANLAKRMNHNFETAPLSEYEPESSDLYSLAPTSSETNPVNDTYNSEFYDEYEEDLPEHERQHREEMREIDARRQDAITRRENALERKGRRKEIRRAERAARKAERSDTRDKLMDTAKRKARAIGGATAKKGWSVIKKATSSLGRGIKSVAQGAANLVKKR